jgi:hypothetical protein
MLALASWSRKGSLGYGSPGPRRSEVDGKTHCGPTRGIGLIRIVACKRARSSLMKLRRTVISDVDQLYPCTLSVVEKVMIRGLATSESGGCD